MGQAGCGGLHGCDGQHRPPLVRGPLQGRNGNSMAGPGVVDTRSPALFRDAVLPCPGSIQPRLARKAGPQHPELHPTENRIPHQAGYAEPQRRPFLGVSRIPGAAKVLTACGAVCRRGSGRDYPVRFVDAKGHEGGGVPEVHRQPSRDSSERSSSRASGTPAPECRGGPRRSRGLPEPRRTTMPARSSRASFASSSTLSACCPPAFRPPRQSPPGRCVQSVSGAPRPAPSLPP